MNKNYHYHYHEATTFLSSIYDIDTSYRRDIIIIWICYFKQYFINIVTFSNIYPWTDSWAQEKLGQQTIYRLG